MLSYVSRNTARVGRGVVGTSRKTCCQYRRQVTITLLLSVIAGGGIPSLPPPASTVPVSPGSSEAFLLNRPCTEASLSCFKSRLRSGNAQTTYLMSRFGLHDSQLDLPVSQIPSRSISSKESSCDARDLGR